MNNWLPVAGLGILALTALSLACTAAYMSVMGIWELLAAIGSMAVVLAILIEWGKLVIVAVSHIFWKSMRWWKWLLLAGVGVQMAVTNIGVFSHLNSGYEDQKIPGQQITIEISKVDQEIDRYQVLEQEAVRDLGILSTAEERMVDKLFVTRSERYLKENEKRKSTAIAKRDDARDEITRLQKIRQTLVTKKEELAAKLGSITHIQGIAGAANSKWVVLAFVLLLVLCLDPMAVALVVLCSHFVKKWFVDEDDIPERVRPVKVEQKRGAPVDALIMPVFSGGKGNVTKRKGKVSSK